MVLLTTSFIIFVFHDGRHHLPHVDRKQFEMRGNVLNLTRFLQDDFGQITKGEVIFTLLRNSDPFDF